MMKLYLILSDILIVVNLEHTHTKKGGERQTNPSIQLSAQFSFDLHMVHQVLLFLSTSEFFYIYLI